MITENTPNGQKIQIFLEELADAYGLEWTTTILLVN
jgi:glutathione S-transferase